VSLNLTLITQIFVFGLLVLFTMKYVWPIILGAMDERSKRIADGLAAAERGQKDLAQSKTKSEDVIREARARAVQIEDQARHRANELIDQAKGAAIAEGERLMAAAQQQIALETTRAREELRKQVGVLAVAAASKLVEKEIDAKTHSDLLSKLAAQI